MAPSVLEVDEQPPEVLPSFSTRWYLALISFWSRNRRTRFFNWPVPLPGMISTVLAFFRSASSMMSFSARSMSRFLL